jgi:hypothetical protein
MTACLEFGALPEAKNLYNLGVEVSRLWKGRMPDLSKYDPLNGSCETERTVNCNTFKMKYISFWATGSTGDEF